MKNLIVGSVISIGILSSGASFGAALLTSPLGTSLTAMDGTRGGGDPLALEFEAIAEAALQNLQSLQGAPFSGVNINMLQNKIKTAQILVSDNALPVSKDGVTQDSAAVNQPGQNLIILNRTDYTKIASTAVQQALALHEFLSLAGLESTGNYPISSQYLIAEGGGTSNTAGQTVSQATNAVSAQTACSEPSGDAATLFSMIADPNISAQTIQSFLQTHIVAGDALNDQCETMFDVSIDQNRQDIFTVLLNQYKPNLSAPQSSSLDSIYSYTIGHGTVAFLGFLKTEASSQQQQLSLAPVVGTGNGYLAGVTDLMLASASNSVSMVQYLIGNGSSVNAAASDGSTALMLAAETSNVNVVQSLIQAGANVNAADSLGNTALMLAAEYHSNMSVMQALIQAGANVNATSADGSTVLMTAAWWKSSVSVIQALIQAGANVNAATPNNGGIAFEDGATALMWAIEDNQNVAQQYNSNVSVIQALIQAGADINVAESDGDTALMLAAETSNASVVQALIQMGANINAAAPDGSTGLMLATEFSNLDAVQALIQAGANVNAATRDGSTALIFAAYPWDSVNGGTTYQEPLQDQIIQALIQAGAHVQAQSSQGDALSIAIEKGAPQSMLTLLGG